METATRYLRTIESLMIENSRLTKDLQEAVKGKLPDNIVPQEMVERCFGKIASILGPTARGGLLDEINILCDEFSKLANEHMLVSDRSNKLATEKEIIEKAVSGSDIDEATPLASKVIRLRGVLEMIKTRLDRLCLDGNYSQSEVVDLRKNLAEFLSGDKK